MLKVPYLLIMAPLSTKQYGCDETYSGLNVLANHTDHRSIGGCTKESSVHVCTHVSHRGSDSGPDSTLLKNFGNQQIIYQSFS